MTGVGPTDIQEMTKKMTGGLTEGMTENLTGEMTRKMTGEIRIETGLTGTVKTGTEKGIGTVLTGTVEIGIETRIGTGLVIVTVTGIRSETGAGIGNLGAQEHPPHPRPGTGESRDSDRRRDKKSSKPSKDVEQQWLRFQNSYGMNM